MTNMDQSAAAQPTPEPIAIDGGWHLLQSAAGRSEIERCARLARQRREISIRQSVADFGPAAGSTVEAL
ncbi:hypothetical protein [Curtobacterium sp. PhB136]|uniref:hypothetical protein n=1 Tax=Curtobacterium sp. PhB136 TaxID=2485181 RepID=UPI00104EFC64|nr:hypothetical protein [Curtobacterium sp. PhB136]TCK58295.1 hypothetical protein EDF27_3907 [Curtobacterium sp. PhB136]